MNAHGLPNQLKHRVKIDKIIVW